MTPIYRLGNTSETSEIVGLPKERERPEGGGRTSRKAFKIIRYSTAMVAFFQLYGERGENETKAKLGA